MFSSLASRLVSAVGSLLGKRNPEEVHDPLEPEKKKKASGRYDTHTDHKDFITMICEMRLALAKSVRKLIRDELEDWHDKITVLGITTDSRNSYLYSMHCSIEKNSSNNKFAITNYFLNYIGAFSHFDEKDRIRLMSKIIVALTTPIFGSVEQYFQTHQSALDTAKQSVDFPTHFCFTNPQPNNVIVTYNKEREYVATGKVIKRATVSNSTSIYVKRNKSANENEIARTLMFASLYIIAEKSKYCLSLAGTPLSHFFNSRNNLPSNSILNFTLDLLAQLYMLEQQSHIHNDVKPEKLFT
ncbi:predicted protein [Naegleria gruberi]|uniref:Predicted protein n=1 Tax=Naegleria gruberi TaxID=5762 RepID=D2VSW0_NAEGR|nr:uncharacterized protein NAEGRDRAFT_72080 [Naegleria gruberi]EFC39968.1 predicted protein [Naegleria gruberi]|eukprot:XP_002672712.1 predicted protein [Naegleria gruberi strain NEG-M]